MYSNYKGAYLHKFLWVKKIPAVYVVEVCIVGNNSEAFVVFIC